ncbi:MAG: bifunctional methylenetetrahydrofolate dehydrogenase/methenyltetrahydrofolate cyclohydrolase FolD [Hydrogenophilus sp.]|nr:bifunctional methylenetetrahydrofolate dehydrogenase/methenyltetrahydrofolate cyclohydrolase FolD [Hydrogenophilus sp.]
MAGLAGLFRWWEKMILDGRAVAGKIKAEVAQRAAELSKKGVQPKLAVVVAGEDPASAVYVRHKVQACTEVGIASEVHRFGGEVTTETLMAAVRGLNTKAEVHGVLVQLPLPPQVDEEAVLDTIEPSKDVDGFHAFHVGRLWQGRPKLVPCTPAGVMRLLTAYGIEVRGREAVVVGRSRIVGRPMAGLLVNAGATVTIAHSQTRDLGAVTRRAELLVVAVGKPGLIDASMVREEAVVVDVGINRLPDGRLAGDVDFATVAPRVRAITPVPGGVGPMTVAMLLVNTLEAAQTQLGGGQ